MDTLNICLKTHPTWCLTALDKQHVLSACLLHQTGVNCTTAHRNPATMSNNNHHSLIFNNNFNITFIELEQLVIAGLNILTTVLSCNVRDSNT